MHGPTDYRPGVGIVLANSGGLVFAGKRRDGRDHPWQMPQGGLFPGEPPLQAALREIHEELGVKRVTLVDHHPAWLRYDYPSAATSRRALMFRGQQHLWFLLRFDGNDRDIQIDSPHAEFSEWQWMEPERLTELVVPFKHRVYQEVLAYFQPTLRRLALGLPLPPPPDIHLQAWPSHSSTAAPVTRP